MKRLFISLLIIFSFVGILYIFTPNAEADIEETVSEEINLESIEIIYEETNDTKRLEELIIECESKMLSAHQMANSARYLGYSEDSYIILTAKDIWNRYNELYIKYIIKLDEIKLEQIKEEEDRIQAILNEKKEIHPVAFEVWYYLKNQGYSDCVCAGIIGNMMVECGGFTLDLDYTAYSPGKYFYGLVQWNKKDYIEIFDKDLYEQLDFLMSNIEYEFNTFGSNYNKNFKYNDFLNITNEREAALAFAKVYERCGSGTYNLRQSCATIAYEFFEF